MNRNSWALIAAALAVVVVVVLGFWSLGSPGHERQIHQDRRTVQALNALAGRIDAKWKSSKEVLPSNLDRFDVTATQDPTTRAPFVYRSKAGSEYELCATFLTDNRNERQSEASFWLHPKGSFCFQFDASVPASPPPYPYSF